jgi:hypothetical protein
LRFDSAHRLRPRGSEKRGALFFSMEVADLFR